MLRAILLHFLLAFTATAVFAQIPAEVFVGHKQTQHEFFFFKDLDSARRFSVFSFARFAVDYKDRHLNSSFISSQVTYNLTPRWGITAGGNYSGLDFNPIVAISYLYVNEKGDFFINLFPQMIISENPVYELFGLAFYTPKISEKWSLFSQLIFGSSINDKFNQHLLSYQQVRLGLGYKNLFQFGIGIDQSQIGAAKTLTYSNNIGVFIRKEL
ncbi:MAG: hypothetical protein NW226_25420 [Microscillaceae bacterium]|nr:hypothetical protein [Microscillaceae bacterium]